MDVINIPPYAPVLMEATRAIGYSIETAIADIIDNSIAAKASKIAINFFPMDNSYISILDNGLGMDQDELVHAMRYGSSNPMDEREISDLGRFGLGLKTASMSQCRKLTVISKKDNNIVGAQWDLDYVMSTGEWSLKLLKGNDLDRFPHFKQIYNSHCGTLVIWQELDRLQMGELNFDASMSRYMDKVREHLSLVFHRYLKGETSLKKIEMSINNVVVEPIDPFLTEKSTQMMDDEVIYIEGEKVVVRPFILPHISQLNNAEVQMLGGEDGIRKKQGFYVYRNKRLLVWGTWFKMLRQGELSKLARIQIDIPNALDSLWTLDIKKSMAIPPEVIRRNVSAIVAKVGETSKRTWTYRGRKETEDSKVHVWKRIQTREGGVVYELNRDYPLVQAFSVLGTNEKRLVEQLLVQIERSLPLNQLYVDLTSDKRIANENKISKDDLTQLLKQFLIVYDDVAEREEMAKRLTITEPFNQYPEILSEILQEVL
ncbi:ATP-binding protein [Bacillus toyonensis]|uniref:ATP-binding protein n=1 Tax=Bacillus toyonensis TaxID=155322 RepID=UPI000BEF75C1|nr:ATP-binding protein [Bacillus toyonensis]PEM16139.1 ATP-binding protein [Bacillus toyonensis]PGA48084.1 ATP-binding protein [Bacillus toyonensis]PGB28366.1 ATP-binding protein [Bacillus toyonensis]PGC33093.1 ATP-binding protein [Bacillus toyonensis]PHF84549.1 ATP-binding protein [Bacillus toyonensis]